VLYVSRLESMVDDMVLDFDDEGFDDELADDDVADLELTDPGELVEEVEQFLRDHDGDS
jgi:hypothetical protein